MLKLGVLHIFLRCSFIFTLKNRQTHRHTWIKYHSRDIYIYIYIYIYIIQINIGPSLRLVSRSLYDILVIRYGSGPSWSLFHLLVDQAIQSLVASPLSLKSHMIWGIVHVCSTPSLISAVWFIQIANLQQQWCSHGSVNTSKKRHWCHFLWRTWQQRLSFHSDCEKHFCLEHNSQTAAQRDYCVRFWYWICPVQNTRERDRYVGERHLHRECVGASL